MSAFAQHDHDRVRLQEAIADLHAASVFGPAPARVKDLGLRLFYLKADIVAMTQVLLDLDASVRPWAELLTDIKLPPATRIRHFRESAGAAIPAIDRLAVGYKALFFFLRAFQDLAYAMLLELAGQKSGAGTSMADCFKREKGGRPSNNAVRGMIVKDVPGYEEWFLHFREHRNALKRGRGHGLDEQDGRIRIGIYLQQGNVSSKVAALGIPDVTKSIEMSAALFRMMKALANS